jgi:carotenoid cleavage dioxygenase-like enzyme
MSFSTSSSVFHEKSLTEYMVLFPLMTPNLVGYKVRSTYVASKSRAYGLIQGDLCNLPCHSLPKHQPINERIYLHPIHEAAPSHNQFIESAC